MKKRFFAFMMTLIMPVLIVAQARKAEVIKEPSFITVNTYDYSKNHFEDDAEEGYVDIAMEKQVSLKDQVTYYRKIFKILSQSGVQNNSQITVDYDPSYSRLYFHTIKIIRGKEIIDQLNPSKIRFIQKETELNMHLYNGDLSAVLFLEDVRKGDIIEYSYSVRGFNPVFEGKYSALLETAYSVPVYSVFYKINVPRGRTLNIKNSITDITASVQQTTSETIYEWRVTDLEPVRVEERIPSWYDPYAMVVVSEFTSWEDVNAWAMKLYPLDIKLSPRLRKKIDEIIAENDSDEKKISSALRFVQDDVRYLGIEMGENSHRPSDPNKVFAQRFGDCKDKSYLLCIMLANMGIEAHPVFINTTYKKTITGWLPAPTIFDHATVTVKVKGRQYWFDPTIAFQRGSINDISYPDYQCGFVVSPGSTSLTTIPLQEKGIVSVKEIFTVEDMSGKARLSVVTSYSGTNADGMRNEFNNNSLSEMRKKFENYYSSYFEKVKADSVSYRDNEATGEFITHEYYTIPDLWSDEKGIKRTSFSPYVINSVLKKPSDAERTMPFSIDYPARYTEDIEVHLPSEWDMEESTKTIQCENFIWKTKHSYSDRKLVLHYEYESLKDHVSPHEAKTFISNFEKANGGFTLTHADGESMLKESGIAGSKRTNPAILVFLVLGFIGLVVWWAQRG